MRIGELAKTTGISASRIRFYEKCGILRPALRRNNGYRDYPPNTVGVLCFIDGAQALGFTLAEVTAALTPGASEMPSRSDLLAGLRHKHDELGKHIESAVAKHRRIAKLIDELEDQGQDTGTAGL